jgi:hypothetical protein
MELPLLIKHVNKEYFVGCDVVHERGLEIFSFSVTEKRTDGTIMFIQCEQLVNNIESEKDKKYLEYIDSLSDFYQCEVMYEKS